MSAPEDPLEILDTVLAQVSGQADARFYHDRWTTLRLANSRLYQPHLEESQEVSLRVVLDGGRIGVATTTDLSVEGLALVVRQATGLAEHAPPLKGFRGFPADPGGRVPIVPTSPAVLKGDVPEKERELEEALSKSQALREPRVAGVYNEGACRLCVANTAGLRVATTRTIAQASILVEDLSRDPPVSGWSEIAHWEPSEVHLGRLAGEALSYTPRGPVKPVEPGTYRVLLRPPAVSTLLSMLMMGGLGAFAIEEGWSFLLTPPEARKVSEAITIDDDPLSPLGLPAAVDYDGLVHQRRRIFESGVASDPAHDLVTATRMGSSSTANALPPEAPWGREGPLPLHLQFVPGTSSEEEMVRELGSGILVTRLHYVRFVHRQKTIITGMTRDGTYRVERGEIVHPTVNLRFTDSILGALARTLLVGKGMRCTNEDERGVGAPVVPSLLVSGFHFSSSTTF